jgi:hypothetical protein
MMIERASIAVVPTRNLKPSLRKFGVHMYPPNPNFEKKTFGKEDSLAKLLEDPIFEAAVHAVNDLGMDAWESLRNFQKPPNVGPSFNEDPIIIEIVFKIDEYYKDFHNSVTMAYTLKRLQYLARNATKIADYHYSKRRDILHFTENMKNVKVNGRHLITNKDVMREIANFL